MTLKEGIQRLEGHVYGLNVDYYFEVITSFPENEWFAASNKGSSNYNICRELAEMKLIAMKRIPIWRDGRQRGERVEFMYNKDLNLLYTYHK